MAAAVRMMSVIREEIPAVVGELASTAKVSTEQVGRLGEMELASVSSSSTAGATMNSIAVRQMANQAAKEGESSILTTLRSSNQTTSHSLLESIPAPPTQLPSINTSMVSQTLEMDMGVSLREVMSNASQTGAGEVLEQVQLGDMAKIIGEGAHI